ncbi:hypothetical protein Tco_1168527, partial [Tanacetum coccineum]
LDDRLSVLGYQINITVAWNGMAKELKALSSQLMRLQFLQLELRLGKIPSRTSGNPTCGCLGLYLVDSLVLVIAHETKHRSEQKLNHLEEALPEAPPATATADVRNAYTRRQATQELFKTVKAFHACKQKEGQSVSTYVLKMKGYLDQMDHLGYHMPLLLGVNLILTSLLKDYDQFVQNYNMHSMGKTIPALHAMLKLAEKGIPKKASADLAIRQGQIQKPKLKSRGKGKGKGKSKLAYSPNQKIPPPTKKEHPVLSH